MVWNFEVCLFGKHQWGAGTEGDSTNYYHQLPFSTTLPVPVPLNERTGTIWYDTTPYPRRTNYPLHKKKRKEKKKKNIDEDVPYFRAMATVPLYSVPYSYLRPSNNDAQTKSDRRKRRRFRVRYRSTSTGFTAYIHIIIIAHQAWMSKRWNGGQIRFLRQQPKWMEIRSKTLEQVKKTKKSRGLVPSARTTNAWLLQ